MKIALPLLIAFGLAGAAVAQDAGKSVWQGIYTPEQADRGGGVYAQRCGACHGAKAEGDEQGHPHVVVPEVAPQQDRDPDRDQDQRAPHGRRARLGEVRFGAVVAHGLADLLRRQPADDAGAGDQRDRQRGEGGEHRP